MEQAIGLMSGTSLDGVDAAVVETDGERIGAFGPSLTIPYDDRLRGRLRTLLDRAASIGPDDPELRAVERLLTLVHVEAVRALEARPTLIGLHGQTILHAPRPGVPGAGRTWQIGDAALLARETGCPVMHDFRGQDVAAGGEGAPLAPLFHASLLPASVLRPVGVLNLGGVANLTIVPGQSIEGVLACDTGPGNALLDDWAHRHTGVACDRDGGLARAGRVDRDALADLLAHPFFDRSPPKSLDRQAFAHALDRIAALSAEDGAATLAAITAGAVARATRAHPLRTVLVCGGGRHNPALMAALRAALGAVPVEPVETLGWDGDALEAQCFAFLAARSLRGLFLSLPGTTGVPAPCGGGRHAAP